MTTPADIRSWVQKGMGARPKNDDMKRFYHFYADYDPIAVTKKIYLTACTVDQFSDEELEIMWCRYLMERNK